MVVVAVVVLVVVVLVVVVVAVAVVMVVTHEQVYLEAGSFINAFDAYRQDSRHVINIACARAPLKSPRCCPHADCAVGALGL